MALLIDKKTKKVFDDVAKKITYENFCEYFNDAKRNINEFFIVSNEKISKYRSSKVSTRQELFKDIEKLYIDNIIYYDEMSVALKNQYSSKNISEENLESFKSLKSELVHLFKVYKEVLDGIENGLKVLDPGLNEKVEQEKARREQERLEEEKRRRESSRKNDDGGDDYHSHRSPGSSFSDYGSGTGVPGFGCW